MKKLTALLLVLVMALGLAACSVQAHADDAAAAPVSKSDVKIPDGADEQISLIFSQFDKLKQDESSARWSYALTDLDHNGQIELLAASIQGQGRYTTLKGWEVKQDKSGLDELSIPLNQGDSFPDVIVDAADTFHDRSADLWYYMLNDQIAVSTKEVYANKSAISLDKGTVKFFTYAFQHNEWLDGRMVTTFTDRGGNIITPEEYNAIGNSVFASMDRSTTRFDWFQAADAVGTGRLSDSYAVFLGLKQPPKPSTPEVVYTPRPDTPSSFLMITKNPTDEIHNEGETAWFVAKAENWSTATWTFVDPYGNEYSWQSFRNSFPQCDVSGGDSGSVCITYTDPGMSGWGAYCTFYGNGQTARSTTAYLTVYANPQPTPPPWPWPTPEPSTGPIMGQMDGVVTDYAMSTITIQLDNGTVVQPLKDICTISGSIDYNCPATVYFYNYPSTENLYYVYIQGNDDPPTPPDNSMGATFQGATMDGAGLALDNGDFVTVPSYLCSNLGRVTYGDSATVYYHGWTPSADNIYHVDIYGRVYDDSGDSDDDQPHATGFGPVYTDQPHATGFGFALSDEDEDWSEYAPH